MELMILMGFSFLLGVAMEAFDPDENMDEADSGDTGAGDDGPIMPVGDLIPTEGDDTITGTEGDESINALAGDDAIDGNGGDDTISGGTGDDTLDGDAGEDALAGDAGDDSLVGGAGSDTLTGGADEDHLDGGADNDVLVGGEGLDTLVGGEGDDTLSGSDATGSDDHQADVLDGGVGDDFLRVGGADRATGGEGSDIFQNIFDSVGTTYINDFNPAEDELTIETQQGENVVIQSQSVIGPNLLITFSDGSSIQLDGIVTPINPTSVRIVQVAT